MKIVLDTNVLVSGLLSPDAGPGEIVRMVSAGFLSLCYDARILSEYKAVLDRPKFKFASAAVQALLDQVKAHGQSFVGIPLQKPLPDQEDEPFLEVAIAANVICLVTGNMKHFPKESGQGINVMKPADFLELYRRNKSSNR